ncbi:MAG TPA: patatin-like phospholipase family protein [Polyangia bacterium]|nr:patatin-like phospholipase family protein [Polyangia bacterium]
MDLHGVNPQAAVAAINARAARFKAGDRTPDGRKLALVIEGGALRGVCSAGGVVALEHLGMTDVFDQVYGTSAGVMNASYFVAGQASLGIRIYYEDMNRREIVNPWRFWNILDLDRLFAQAILGSKRLQLDAVLAARSRLYIAALDAEAATGRLFDAQALGTPERLLEALRAATAVPLLYNKPTTVDGHRCLDAGVVNAFPVADAVAAGCTDILVMLTRPLGYRRPMAGRLTRWLFGALCARGNTKLTRAYALRHEQDAAQRNLAFGRAPVPAGVNIATICTNDDEAVQRMTTDRALLQAGALAFGRKTLRALGADPAGWALA